MTRIENLGQVIEVSDYEGWAITIRSSIKDPNRNDALRDPVVVRIPHDNAWEFLQAIEVRIPPDKRKGMIVEEGV